MVLAELKDAVKTSLVEGDSFALVNLAFSMKKHNISEADILKLTNRCMKEIGAEFERGSIDYSHILKASDNYNMFLSTTDCCM